MSDDGFFTACPTCAADLKVRERSAIGQIFACPMCGSMVLVESPDASDPLPESAAAVMPEESQAEPQPIAELENSARSLPFAAGFVSLLAVAVVLGGMMEAAGMPRFDDVLSPGQSADIKAYVIDRAHDEWALQQHSDWALSKGV